MHSHVDVWTLPFASSNRTPSVLTLHGRLDTDYMQTILPMYPDVPLVSVSDNQREPMRERNVRWAGTVHNGLDLGHYASNESAPGDHLAFVGRISPEKGPILAIDVARRSGRPLRLAAKVDPMDVDYFEHEVEPLLGPGAEFVGELNERQKPELLRQCRSHAVPQ